MDTLSLTDSLPDIKPDLSLDSSITLHDPQLPTPPFSPHHHGSYPFYPAHDAVSVANDLMAFYQKESVWAHHTRASLELALTADGCDSFTTAAARAKHAIVPSQADPEPPSASSQPAQKRSSRWMQRKQSFNLNIKLDANRDPAATALARRRRRDSHQPRLAPPPEASTRLLELFSELVEARMESCARMSALAQSVYATRPCV